jgi:hypothetical protein
MKKVGLIILLIGSMLGWRAAMTQSNPSQLRAEFPGASVKWLHIAEPEFQYRKLDLDKYIIVIVEKNKSVIVYLKSFDSAEEAFGSTGSYIGYEVEIDKKDLKIKRANYVR